MKTSQLFSGTYEKLWKKTLEINDIFPIGRKETLRIKKTAENYPNVIRLNKSFSGDRLLADFIFSRPYLEDAEKSIFECRGSFFIGASTKEILSIYSELGFTTDKYNGYGLRKPGSTKLLPTVGNYTCQCLDQTGKHFRQVYTIAQPGWCSKPHVDNKNMEWHGFKILLSVNVDGYIGYVCAHGVEIYKMKTGVPYFCNTSVPHFGMNPLKEERIGLNFHISSDKDLLKGRSIDPENETLQDFPISWKQELYQDYTENYKILLK